MNDWLINLERFIAKVLRIDAIAPFEDQDLEKSYAESINQRISEFWDRSLQYLVFPLIISVCAHIFLRYEQLTLTMIGCEVGIIIVAFTGLMFNKRKSFTKYSVYTHLALTITGQLLVAAIMILAHPDRVPYFSGIFFVTMLLSTVAPSRISLKLILSALAVTLYFIVYSNNEFLPERVLTVQSMLMAMGMLSIMVTAMGMEAQFRSRFLLHIALEKEKVQSDRLLQNMLPLHITTQLKQPPDSSLMLVEQYDQVTVMFADLVGFTKFVSEEPPEVTIQVLADLFHRFDAIMSITGVEKIKTIGDSYMAVAGLPNPMDHHAHVMADAALEIREAIKKYRHLTGLKLDIRIGLHSGPVTAGVIGTHKFCYDLWGDTVNMASRMESHGLPGEIQVSEATMALIADKYNLRPRGGVEIKGKGRADTYILEAPKVEEKPPSQLLPPLRNAS